MRGTHSFREARTAPSLAGFFAAAVNHDDIALGARKLGLEPAEPIQMCIDALTPWMALY